MNREITSKGISDRVAGSSFRKRELTEDRRRQNRDAQRRYRERRKLARDPCGFSSSIDTGLLDASPASVMGHVPCDSSFSDCLFQPVNEGFFTEPIFLSDMMFLDSPVDTEVGEQITQKSNTSTSRVDTFPTNHPETFAATEASLPLLEVSKEGRSHLPRSARTVVNAPLPSPYQNHLTIQKLSFYAARIQNALHLGLPVFLAQKEDDISPWYWHAQFSLLISQEPSPEPATLTGSLDSPYEFTVNRPVRRCPCFVMSDAIVSDLSPTPLQRSHAHGMYLDIVPFPIFRDRAIMLLSTDPPAFDEKELKRDMENEGLMVWGVGHGSASRAATLVRDKRNWECSRWFYRKWRLLVEGSGLEEQSQWWRMMRGEEESDDEDSLEMPGK